MKFLKMHGAGNDFVVMEAMDGSFDQVDLPQLSRQICDRHFGVGADGLILVRPGSTADLRMQIINRDGSEAEMCGNGIRCFAKYAYDHGLWNQTTLRTETPAGTMVVELNIKGQVVESVRVDMGEPILEPSRIPVDVPDSDDRPVRVDLHVDGGDFRGHCVSMGNPHCVVYVDDLDTFPLTVAGPQIEHHPLFPRRTNVPFVQLHSDSELKVQVWERAVGATLACGTGGCASVVASHLLGLTGRDVTVRLPGGVLQILWASDNHVFMDGPAANVFEGDYPVS